MVCRFRRDSPGCNGTQENDSDYPLGMESRLKKLLLEADATGFQDPERTPRSPGEQNCAERLS